MPGVVVGDTGQAGVAHAGLAGQAGLGQGRHADYARAPALVEERFGAGAECGSFDDQQRTAGVARGACRSYGALQGIAQRRAVRAVQRHVGHDAVAEERWRPGAIGTVDQLVRDDEMQRRDVLTQAAYSANRKQAAYAQRCKREDVGAVRHLAGAEPMARAVACDERDASVAQTPEYDVVGGVTEWRVQV